MTEYDPLDLVHVVCSDCEYEHLASGLFAAGFIAHADRAGHVVRHAKVDELDVPEPRTAKRPRPDRVSADEYERRKEYIDHRDMERRNALVDGQRLMDGWQGP